MAAQSFVAGRLARSAGRNARVLYQIERPARREIGDQEFEPHRRQRIHRSIGEKQAVVRLEIAVEASESAGHDIVGVLIALVEGQAVAEDARLFGNFLQFELEFRPGVTAIVEYVHTHVQDAVGIFPGGREWADRFDGAYGEHRRRSRLEFLGDDDGIATRSLSGNAGDAKASQFVGEGVGARYPYAMLLFRDG